jgi:hypothetical protein
MAAAFSLVAAGVLVGKDDRKQRKETRSFLDHNKNDTFVPPFGDQSPVWDHE